MAGWVAKYFLPDAEGKDTSENQASIPAGTVDSVTSYFSGFFSPRAVDASVDSRSHKSVQGRESRNDHQDSEQEDNETNLDKSWEDVDMAELKPKVVASQPRVEVTTSEHGCCGEVNQQLSDLQKKVSNLEDAVQTQGKQKRKWLRKQPSKDKGDECAQAIQAKETKIREKESEIHEKDKQIRYYKRKLDNAEELDKQSAQLAAELSEKESKLREVSRQLLHLQQEMKTVMTENTSLKQQVAKDRSKHEDEVKKLRAKEARSESHVEVVLVSDSDPNQISISEKKEVAQLKSRVATLQADLDKSVAHSKAQSREILTLKQHIQGAKLESEDDKKSAQGQLDDYEVRVSDLQEQLKQVRLEKENYKSKQDRLSAELLHARQAYQAETKHRKLLEAQLDDDHTQCPKARCIKDYDTLAAENDRLQKNIVDISEENRRQTQTIIDLKKTIQDLNGQLTSAKLQAESNKLDFEAERKDREVAHSKLADLENTLAKEKSRIDVERAAYKKHFGQGSKEKEKVEKDMDNLRSELAKHKAEEDKLREDMKAKVSQVRQYKKENDRLKAQVEQSVSSMVKLTDEMEAMRKKAKKGEDPKKKLSSSVLPDPSMAAEKRVAKMEKLCDHYQTENAELREKSSQLTDEVEHLTKINSELKKLLKQDPYGGATRHEEAQASSAVSPTQDGYPSLGDNLSDRPQSLPSLENESQTAGTGELHREIPYQLQIPPGDGQPRTKPMSAPLQAVDPEQQRHRQPPKTTPLRAVDPEQQHRQQLHVSAPLGAGNLGTQHQQQPPISYAPLQARGSLLEQPRTVPAYAPKSPSPVAQKRNKAEAPTVQVVGPNQLGSPQHAPAQSQLKTPFNHPQSVHSYDHSRVQLNQYGQSHVPHAATTPGGGYGYNDTPHYGGEQPSGRFLSWDPHHQPPSPRVDPSYDPNKYADSAQLATHPPHSGTYQPVVTTSEPQYPTQSRSGDQPQHHRHSQPHSQKETQPTPEYGPPKHEVTVRKERSEPGLQQKPAFDQLPLLPVAKTDAEDDHDQEDDEDLRFQNRLQDKVDDDIEREASEVMQQVSGGRRHITTDRQRPFDPNLVCPMCMKQFRIGEIQKFKHHVNTCDGTDSII